MTIEQYKKISQIEPKTELVPQASFPFIILGEVENYVMIMERF